MAERRTRTILSIVQRINRWDESDTFVNADRRNLRFERCVTPDDQGGVLV